MKKNLFQAVKTYINGVEVGETFTTKHLIDMVGDHEVSTWWKQSNQNPYYRTHTYKSYLKRTGFISSSKRGVWKVEKNIPEFVTLGTVEFLFGYKKTYKGMTKAATIEKINNLQYKSPLLEDFTTKPGFVEKRLSLQEEHEKQNQVRILSEIKEDKIMKVKFDFNEGILRVKGYLENNIEQTKTDLFQDIKQCDDIDDLRRAISDFEFNERVIEQAIENLEQAGSILEVLNAVEDTVLGGLDETVIGLLFNVDITVL
jgi:hypothetical protein